MARLPQPGSDDGKWGEILNDFLSESLTSDGKVKLGAVTKSDIGLGNVDNTSDADKPISTATQSALDQKVASSALDGLIASNVDNNTSQTSSLLSEKFAPYLGSVPFIDLRDFIIGPWTSGQTNSAPTTTLSSPANAGTSTLNISDASSTYTNGIVLLVNAGTPQQQQYRVTAGGGTNTLTVTPSIASTLATGTTVRPLWGDSAHLSEWSAHAQFIVDAKLPDGTNIIKDPGDRPIVLLGNSWFVAGGTAITTKIQAKFSNAIVINRGVNGNTSSQLLARFDSDIPSNAAYVIINEPGVNDCAHGALTFRDQSMRNTAALVAKCRAIGATPVFIGPPPLSQYPNNALDNAIWLKELLASPSYPFVPATSIVRFLTPSVTPEPFSVAIGQGALDRTTTAKENVAIGRSSLLNNPSVDGIVAIGNNSAPSLTSGLGQSVFIGNIAGYGSTSTGRSVMVGSGAGYPSGTNSTRTASNVVAIGYQAGASNDLDPASYTAIGSTARAAAASVALGQNAIASGQDTTALGAQTSASFNGSVAIGRDNTSVSASASEINEFALGTAQHKVKIRGRLTIAQRTPISSTDTQGAVGDITSDDSYIYVKTSSGWKRAPLSSW